MTLVIARMVIGTRIYMGSGAVSRAFKWIQ